MDLASRRISRRSLLVGGAAAAITTAAGARGAAATDSGCAECDEMTELPYAKGTVVEVATASPTPIVVHIGRTELRAGTADFPDNWVFYRGDIVGVAFDPPRVIPLVSPHWEAGAVHFVTSNTDPALARVIASYE